MLKNCCCCIDLRIGGVVIGLVDLLIYCLELFFNAVNISWYYSYANKDSGTVTVTYYIDDYNETVMDMIKNALGIVFSLCLIIGAAKKDSRLVFPWLLSSIFSITVYFFNKILMLMLVPGFTLGDAFFSIRLLMIVYFMLVIRSLHRKLRKEEHNGSHLIANLHIDMDVVSQGKEKLLI